MSIDNDLQTLWETVQSLKAYPESEMIGKLIESVLVDNTFTTSEASELVRLKNENLLLRKEIGSLKMQRDRLFSWFDRCCAIMKAEPGNSITLRLQDLVAKEHALQSLAESSQN